MVMAIDPVCGMRINEEQEADRFIYDNRASGLLQIDLMRPR